jgi:hypothetical protein
MICPHCHCEFSIWNGVKDCLRRCLYCGVLLVTTFSNAPAQTSLPGPEPPPPILITAGPVAPNTNTATAGMSWPNYGP